MRTVISIVLVTSMFFIGCTTGRNERVYGDSISDQEFRERILEHGRDVDEFNSRLERIRDRAQDPGITIFGAVELLSEYHRAVGDLLESYKVLRAGIE